MKIWLALLCVILLSCHQQRGKEQKDVATTRPAAVTPAINFKAHVTEHYDNGTFAELDTISGYRKYYYKTGKLQMEGKVTKASSKDYRDGVWKYYNEREQLMLQEEYNEKGKLNSKAFTWFINNKPMTEVEEYYEGDYKDKASFKFHKIEKIYTYDGKLAGTKHWINGQLVD